MPPLTRVTRVVYKATLRAVAKLEANARGDLGLVLGAERVTLGHPNIDLRSAVQPHDDAVTQPAHLCDNLRIVVPREAEGLTHRVRSAYRAGGHSCVDRMDAALALLAEVSADSCSQGAVPPSRHWGSANKRPTPLPPSPAPPHPLFHAAQRRGDRARVQRGVLIT